MNYDMNNWTIGKKVGFGFAVLIVLIVTLGTFSYFRLTAIRECSDIISKKVEPTVAACQRLEMNMRGNLAICYKHLGSTNAQDKAALEKELKSASTNNAEALKELTALTTSQEDLATLEKVGTLRSNYIAFREKVFVVSRQLTNNAIAYQMARQEMEPICQNYVVALQGMAQARRTEAKAASEKIDATVDNAIAAILAGISMAALLGCGIAFGIVKSTSRALRSFADLLNNGSNQVSAASGSVSESSQSLAEGASEQAASLEEISSSLEEMSSMTKNNAANAEQVEKLAKQARTAADQGSQDMQTLDAAMNEIKKSSDDITKILKTIDEIAFQTNILALNAAVEAARAGEAGMGFAVVAGEVRSLAQRSAQAAKETSAQIAAAVANSDQGVAISAKVRETLEQIVNRVRDVDRLAADVSTATREQSQGIEQVTTAIAQMDKVTQTNAAAAEESASASEELYAQAEMMRGTVADMLLLVSTRQQLSPDSPPHPSSQTFSQRHNVSARRR
jgi:methyl-accepting chemotaxis protein